MQGESGRVFALRWNPRKSGFRRNDFEVFFKVATNGGTIDLFEWEIRDWESVRKGDAFYLSQVGTDDDGIVMHGVFAGECHLDNYAEGELSPLGRKGEVHVAPLRVQGIFRGEKALSADALGKEFPEVDWHSDEQGEALDERTGARLIAYVEKVIGNADLSNRSKNAGEGCSDSVSGE